MIYFNNMTRRTVNPICAGQMAFRCHKLLLKIKMNSKYIFIIGAATDNKHNNLLFYLESI